MKLASIDIQSRPLRLVYLVANREDILDAVTLYTHIWGGFANAIFPIPSNEQELEKLKFALSSINPDFIFSSRQIDENIIKEIQQFPKVRCRLISNKDISHFIHGEFNWIHDLDLRNFPHIIPILLDKYTTEWKSSNIHISKPDGKYKFNLALQGGILSDNYYSSLTEYFKAQVIHPPLSIKKLIQTECLLNNNSQPIDLTNFAISTNIESEFDPNYWKYIQNHYPYHKWIENRDALYIFCDDDSNVKVSCDYWNSCLIGRWNKIIVPKEEFLNNLDEVINTCSEVMPFLHQIYITISLEKEEAINLGDRIKEIIEEKSPYTSISIQINYDSFGFNFVPSIIYCDHYSVKITTQVISKDNSLRFAPSVPSAYQNGNYLFGYNAKISFDSGKKLFIPTLKSSKLLALLFSHHINTIEDYEKRNQEHILQAENTIPPSYNVRSNQSKKGGLQSLTGITFGGEECKIYIPSDEVMISRWLKQTGLKLTINEHTRYVKGFIRRFGGIEKAIFLINKEGADILSAFLKYKDEESLDFSKFMEYLGTYRHWPSQSQSQKKHKREKCLKILSNFVEKLLINRGYSANCPTCNLVNFYSLEEVKEVNECKGCGELFLLPFDIHETITYKLNELARKLFQKEGGLAILMSINILSQIEWSSYTQLGGELTKEDKTDNFAEVDLFWLTEHGLTIVECKSIHDHGDSEKISDNLRKRIEETYDQFQDLITDVAPLIDAKVTVLSIVTNIPDLKIIDLLRVNELQNLGEKNKIKIHLIINWELYINGEEKLDLITQRRQIMSRFFPDSYPMEELDTIKIEKN